ncbi:PAS domain S-box protein [Chitinibacter bivalviorum]|uniref:histidine kinase n=1 Tax=Chitinibacter bivalviorum TaxID=2739434 RepID=A0A7H9BIH8_9NEIS|nr:PAS domain S-box protein [Chitinibacter bivalviorum]QLG87354.1 PAS domain S-box protein [Chitinibacter bivalviorum]
MRALRTGLLGFYGVMVLLVLLTLAWITVRDYHQAIAEAERSDQSLARALDENATRAFLSAEQGMQNIAEDLDRQGGVEHADEYLMHLLLKDKVRLTPQIRGIITIGPNGIIHSHGLEFPARKIDLSDRSYFQYHSKYSTTQNFISEPVISRTDGKWLIPLTRRIDLPSGEFGGVLLSGMEPSYFLKFYESLTLPKGVKIQVLRSDGVVLVNYPFDENKLASNLRQHDSLRFEQLRLKRSSSFITKTPQGADQLVTFMVNQSDLPLIIVITHELDTLLATFQTQTITRILAGLGLMAVVSILLYLLLRQIRRVEDIEGRIFLTQHTVDESPDLTLWCDHSGLIRYANKSLAAMSGLSRRELMNQHFGDLFADINDQAWLAYWQQLQNEKQVSLESALHDNNGNTTPMELTLSLIKFQREAYICCTARDISQRRQAEQELRQHRDQLHEMVQERTAEIRTVLDASPLAIMLSMNNVVRLVNPAFELLFGYASSDIIGTSTQHIFQSSDQFDETRQKIWSRIATGGVYRGETELYRRDHTPFWAMIYAKALVAGDMSKGMIAVIEDITAQRIAAQALRQSERLNRTIIDQTADGFLLIDTQHRICDVNHSFSRLLGFSRETLIGLNPQSLWGDTCTPFFPQDLMDLALQEHTTKDIELADQHGRIRPFLINSGVVLDENENIEYAYAFFTDIAQLKEIEKRLVEAKDAAESANFAKSSFLANMSHELRTPMHAILSFSEMGLAKTSKLDLPENAHLNRYYERINASGKRLLVLLNDLLDMSRLEANKMSYDKGRHSLQLIVRMASAEMGSLISGKQLQIKMDDGQEEILAIFDKARITQVMVNLLSNAIKFSPVGSNIDIQFLPEVTLDDGSPAVGVEVHDHGPGIPPEELETIFDKFIQSSRVKVGGGTGLGLAISRQIMLDHGGQISAQNHPDGGAIFQISLPVQSKQHASTS